MANTTRQDILEKIKSVLEGVASINYVEIDRITAPDLNQVPLPCAFIYSDREDRIGQREGTIGNETWDWTIVLEVWAKDKELETILQQIHTAMWTNRTLDSNAEFTHRVGVEFFYIDPGQSLRGMVVTYIVRYDHTQGTM